MTKTVYLRTFGCQMNVRDSEIIRGMLEDAGYCFVDTPEKADIVIFNTCSVREHAEHRAVSILASIARKKPRRIFGLVGCVAQHRKEALFKTIPRLNFICGPADIYSIPELIDSEVRTQRSELRDQKSGVRRQIAVSGKKRPVKCVNPAYREKTSHCYVNIMYGCNNFCSYCIVPYVRGREVSRPVTDIINEVEDLVKRDIKDVMLLGQNVNSYKEGSGFIELLEKINNINGIKHISFMTSHPKDASVELFEAMKNLEHVTKDLHLPFQSGSNRILELMNRGYTIEQYMKLADEYKNMNPDGRFTTDIIVGFPTEAEEDFCMTKKVMEEIRFDGAYIFKYSPRSPAKSSVMKDDVGLEEKKRRNNALLHLQKEINKTKK